MKPIKGKLNCKKCPPNKGCNSNMYKLIKKYKQGHETRKDFRHKLQDYKK